MQKLWNRETSTQILDSLGGQPVCPWEASAWSCESEAESAVEAPAIWRMQECGTFSEERGTEQSLPKKAMRAAIHHAMEMGPSKLFSSCVIVNCPVCWIQSYRFNVCLLGSWFYFGPITLYPTISPLCNRNVYPVSLYVSSVQLLYFYSSFQQSLLWVLEESGLFDNAGTVKT